MINTILAPLFNLIVKDTFVMMFDVIYEG